MAGRGRGRGGRSMLPLSSDPSMKIEPSLPVLVPPPNYPTLEYKALPTTIGADLNYLLLLKKSFADDMRESPNNVQPKVVKKDIERYSDRYQESTKQRYDSRFDWTRLPAELKPVAKRKGDKNESKSKKLKEVDVSAKLQELETKEATTQSDGEEDEKADEDDEDKDDEKVEEDEEDSDEEMDKGTDYVNNYFDNGENYEDDDENVDDGPIF